MRWDAWGGLDAPYLVQSRVTTRGRVLLESPYGWQWYLGERVVRQSLGLDHFRVPGPLPPLVQRTQEYTLAEVEAFTVLDTELVFSPSGDYDDYVVSSLAYFLDMEARLAASVLAPASAERPVLPVLRREIDVMLPNGSMGYVVVPEVTPPVTLTATEVFLKLKQEIV